MAYDDPTVRWNLLRAQKAGVLGDAEIVCDADAGWMGGRVSAIVVTDLRVLILHTGVIRRRTTITEFPLGEIESVEARPGEPVDHGAALALKTTEGNEFVFPNIKDGVGRAEELASTIRQQRMFLERLRATSAEAR